MNRFLSLRQLWKVGLAAAFSLFLLPVAVSAAGADSAIDSVSVLANTSEVSATGVTYNVSVVTVEEVSTLSCFMFDGTDPKDSPFDFSSVEVTTSDSELLAGADVLWDKSDDGQSGVVGVVYTLGSAMATGEHAFAFTDVTNPSADGTFKIGCTSSSDMESASYTNSVSFDIGEGSSDVNLFSEVIWTVDSNYLGESTDYTFIVTLDTAMAINDSIQFIFQENGSGAPEDSGVNLENATVTTSDGLLLSDPGTNLGVVTLPLRDRAAAGSHTVTFSGVVNPDTEITVSAGLTNDPDASNWIYADEEVTFVELTAPAKVKKKKMSTKKIQKKKANVKWTAVDTADSYTVQLRKCKNEKKKKCTKAKHFQKKKNYRKFKNLTGVKKTIKKLKKGTYYQWRIKATNDAGSSAWSVWKRFTTKG